ncbi:hypothetical protein CEXT_228581 [Caerostris extrusa]|uniref:Secreted protein n=1 Tax=Caerostris extrusa TaxID=172846 RepID=A0AAV4NAI4_CAEEX|nr:hypothetical protein CEXT_228581 [Caerostris extrusa]
MARRATQTRIASLFALVFALSSLRSHYKRSICVQGPLSGPEECFSPVGFCLGTKHSETTGELEFSQHPV